MTKRIILLVAAIAMIAVACGSDADDAASGSIEIQNARYRIAREDLGAGYLNITNGTSETVVLKSASAEGVGRIELHESMADAEGVMSMEPRPEGFTIEPGESIALEPGGKHLMLFDPATDSQDLGLSLDFGSETVEVVAVFDAEASAMTNMDMDDMEHEGEDMDDMEHEGEDMDEAEG